MVTKKQETLACTVWDLEYRGGGSDKFYRIFVAENNVVVLQWGRRGTIGQSSCVRYGSYDEARDQALKQFFAKKSKGYSATKAEFKFVADVKLVDWALQGDPHLLARAYQEALSKGAYDGAREAVLKHYEDFSESVKSLMVRADSGDTEQTMNEYEQLESVWEEIDNKHAEVSAALGIAKVTLMQKMMAGTL